MQLGFNFGQPANRTINSLNASEGKSEKSEGYVNVYVFCFIIVTCMYSFTMK